MQLPKDIFSIRDDSIRDESIEDDSIEGDSIEGDSIQDDFIQDDFIQDDSDSHVPFRDQSYQTTDNQNTMPHPFSMSSKSQAFPDAQSVFSPPTIQDTSKNVKFISGLKLHTQDEAKPPTDNSVIGRHVVIAAESALEGIRGKEMAIEAASNDFKISRSEYAVLAGFNESLMRSGTGYLSEIHIFCSLKELSLL